MHLSGSCRCGAVRFTVEAPSPGPYQHCHCSICRKTAGSAGSAVNIGACADTLAVEGRRHLAVYRARLEDGSRSSAERRFCLVCGSHLWLRVGSGPELLHPHAGAIDTPLPVPPERVHVDLADCPGWARPGPDPERVLHEGFPAESLAQWHERDGRND